MNVNHCILAGLILCIALASGCIGGSDNGSNGSTLDLELSITISKTSFVVGEEIDGDYVVENKASSLFKVYIIQSCEKQGYDSKCLGRGITSLGKSSTGLNACEITETSRSCVLESFSSPGTYTYKLMVYDCADIEETFGVDCSEADMDDVAAQGSPLSTAEKVVTVTEQ